MSSSHPSHEHILLGRNIISQITHHNSSSYSSQEEGLPQDLPTKMSHNDSSEAETKYVNNNPKECDATDPSERLDLAISRREGTTRNIRNISTLEIISAGWNICNSWSGQAATLAIGLTQGGPVTVIYGLFLILICLGSSALTLAELASVYPTAGGQYHWTSILAPARFSRGLSYACGAINLFGWISITAGVTIIPAQLIIGIALFFRDDYTAKPWHLFLIYQIGNLGILVYNIYLLKRTPWIHNIGFFLSLSAFFTVIVVCLARSSSKQSSEFVWTTFTNQSGWTSDGVLFLTGLVTPNYMFAGLDGAIHLAEECSNAKKAVPLALMATLGIGFVSSFAFVVTSLYTMSDFAAVLGTRTAVPVYEIWHQATRSEGAATVFIMCILLGAFFAMNGSQQTASRLTCSFARDDGIVLSKYLSRVHPKLEVPVIALLANASVVFLIGCIYLASTTAFNALIGTGLLLQQITFAFPAALLLFRRRSSRFLPVTRTFRLGVFGWFANAVTVGFSGLILVMYNFPVVLPVTGRTMNYTSVVLATMAIFAILNWVFYARKVYRGPRLPEA